MYKIYICICFSVVVMHAMPMRVNELVILRQFYISQKPACRWWGEDFAVEETSKDAVNQWLKPQKGSSGTWFDDVL